MKNIKQLFAATTLASLMAVAGQANADSVSFWDHLGNVDVKLRENGVGIGDKYELIQIGLNPSLYAGATINSVNLKIWLSDDVDIIPRIEVAQIEAINGTNVFGLTYLEEVGSNFPNVEYDLDVTSFFSASGLNFTALLQAEQGDFDYHNAKLTIDYTPAPVPVPAAAWLLGSGLAGLGLIKRRNG